MRQMVSQRNGHVQPVMAHILDTICGQRVSQPQPIAAEIEPSPLDWVSAWLYLQPDHEASLPACRKAVVAVLAHVRAGGEASLSEREARIFAAWQDVVGRMRP